MQSEHGDEMPVAKSTSRKRKSLCTMTMGKKLTSTWALSSDGSHHRQKSDRAIKQECKGQNLARIFTACHANLLSVVMVLMNEYGLRLAVASPFLDPEEAYIKTGKYDYGASEMKLVSSFMICAVGSIEKVLIAALQVLFANGPRDGEGTDYAVRWFSKDSTCDVHINFKFNDFETNVKLSQSGRSMAIYIYIDD